MAKCQRILCDPGSDVCAWSAGTSEKTIKFHRKTSIFSNPWGADRLENSRSNVYLDVD